MNTNRSSALRIGLTMRVATAPDYAEQRDCLAQDWSGFLSEVFPDALWLALPNLGAKVVSYAQNWGVNALIFSGGNDMGNAPRRDATELALFKYALRADLPLLGVCRGLQFLQIAFGGQLEPCDSTQHMAKRHKVQLTAAYPLGLGRGKEVEVNSYHCYGVRQEGLSDALVPIAVTEDGWVEGLLSRQGKFCAIMWHPERESECSALEKALFRTWLGGEECNAG